MKLTPEQLCKRYDHLKSKRGIWEQHWQEVLDYTLPNAQDVITKRTPGTKKGVLLFDNTAMNSCEDLGAALHGMLTNPNIFWHEYTTSDQRLNEDDNIREYLQFLTAQMHGYLNASNFQTEVHQFYLDLCTIGTACMTIEKNEEKIFHFSTKHIADYVISENNLGMVEELLRTFKWTASQVLQEFVPTLFPGKSLDELLKFSEKEMKDKFGDKIIECYKNGKSDEFELLHGVYKSDLLAAQGKSFVSQYVLKSEKDKKEFRVNGFRRFPYVVARWIKMSGEVYGRSPAMKALPNNKSVNQMLKAVIKAAQKVVDPPTQGPDDGFLRPLKTAPGSHHYYRAGSPDRIEAIFKDINPRIGLDIILEERRQIKEGFYIDKLNLLQSDRMTTVEVTQRIDEQLRFLAPMLGRQYTEFLIPLSDRMIDLAVEADAETGEILGDVPEELLDQKLNVQYTSPIARSQIVTQGQSMVRALEASAQFLQLDPTAGDVIDAKEAVRLNWRNYGAPQKALRTNKELEELAQARQEAQEVALQQQQGLVEAEQIQKVAPVLKG